MARTKKAKRKAAPRPTAKRRPTPARGRTVGDLMVREVLTVEPGATLAEAAQRMREENVGMLPIVEQGILRGVITDRDLVVRGMARGADPAGVTVAECATTEELTTARPEWSDEEALRVMAGEQVGRLPVTDEQGRLLGVVTLSSLLLRSPRAGTAVEAAKAVSKRSARAA